MKLKRVSDFYLKEGSLSVIDSWLFYVDNGYGYVGRRGGEQ
jgi:hypothetical protein